MLANNDLCSNRIILRNLEIDDCNDTYLSWLNDENVNMYLETRWEKQTLEKITQFVVSIRESTHSIIFAIIAICENGGGMTHIGNIKIGPIDHYNKHADISYFIGNKEYWNKGYATDAVKLVIQYGFDVLDLHRISAGVIDGNTASSVLLKEAGMSEEGILREASFDGKIYRDCHRYSIINNLKSKDEQI